ncbi:hypothetical protein C0J52_26740 [Blattella germanica]|nr:hypothetical protein C0J52_26740 [Blattella germanica]
MLLLLRLQQLGQIAKNSVPDVVAWLHLFCAFLSQPARQILLLLTFPLEEVEPPEHRVIESRTQDVPHLNQPRREKTGIFLISTADAPPFLFQGPTDAHPSSRRRAIATFDPRGLRLASQLAIKSCFRRSFLSGSGRFGIGWRHVTSSESLRMEITIEEELGYPTIFMSTEGARPYIGLVLTMIREGDDIRLPMYKPSVQVKREIDGDSERIRILL